MWRFSAIDKHVLLMIVLGVVVVVVGGGYIGDFKLELSYVVLLRHRQNVLLISVR